MNEPWVGHGRVLGCWPRGQPKGPSADRQCPVSISAVSGTAQVFLFLFWLNSMFSTTYGIQTLSRICPMGKQRPLGFGRAMGGPWAGRGRAMGGPWVGLGPQLII